jgi:hypothetical protein
MPARAAALALTIAFAGAGCAGGDGDGNGQTQADPTTLSFEADIGLTPGRSYKAPELYDGDRLPASQTSLPPNPLVGGH